ncbi:DUF4260 domain-containing protein [Streptomyces sp. RY43-2]|uniref:DUF4260 domain-containing protein n=1 Tax=Streptomyces macrolidinus TaxID=2952607 RepID=A0ABT0ZFM5_9ACTN|nr:DUF4260 family protein [Streptomyces macrolidinus]MCN9242390.1 DUF4260 domain-containing protein [Streptomyces macrolidinus]
MTHDAAHDDAAHDGVQHDGAQGAIRSSASRQVRVAWGLLSALLLIWVVFEAVKYGGWAIVAAIAGVIAPDLSFFAGGRGPHQHGQLPRRAVPFYNLLHRVPVALAVTLTCLIPDAPAVAVPLFTFGLAWMQHIASDRALGYGLRTADGWQR